MKRARRILEKALLKKKKKQWCNLEGKQRRRKEIRIWRKGFRQKKNHKPLQLQENNLLRVSSKQDNKIKENKMKKAKRWILSETSFLTVRHFLWQANNQENTMETGTSAQLTNPQIGPQKIHSHVLVKFCFFFRFRSFSLWPVLYQKSLEPLETPIFVVLQRFQNSIFFKIIKNNWLFEKKTSFALFSTKAIFQNGLITSCTTETQNTNFCTKHGCNHYKIRFRRPWART